MSTNEADRMRNHRDCSAHPGLIFDAALSAQPSQHHEALIPFHVRAAQSAGIVLMLAAAAFAQTNGIVVTPPGGNNFGTKIAAHAGTVSVILASNSSPAGEITIEVRFDPPCAPSHNESASHTVAFSEGQDYSFSYGCAGDLVAVTLVASGPGVRYTVSATPSGGTNARESGSL